MKKPILTAALLIPCLVAAASAESLVGVFGNPENYQPLADYTIDVRLDPDTKAIACAETLIWRNATDNRADYVPLHLYWNAFRNDRSTFFVEKGGPGRKVRPGDWGYCQIESAALLDSAGSASWDLTDSLSYIQPDDNNDYDMTVTRVGLPRAVGPGEEIKLALRFRGKFPRTLRRSGFRGDYFYAAQWFPKAGVLEADGGWNCHQYHWLGEFFADYGEYDVRLRVPDGYVVGATGERIARTENPDGTVTHRFRQSAVHDFAWTADRDYVEVEETYGFRSGRQVLITLLLRPEHRHLRGRYLTAVKYGLQYYSDWCGEYPYTTVTCVDPAWGSGAGGMEYPTFFTGGAEIFSPRSSRSPEGVTVHEFGHGYWYGLVGNNEFEDAWMDEGFNTFMTDEVIARAYGPQLYQKRYFEIPLVFPEVEIPYNTARIEHYRTDASDDVLVWNSWEYMDEGSYRSNAYYKPSLMLRTFMNLVGESRFFDIMRAYSRQYRFRHPKPEDFLAAVRERVGDEYDDFFGQLLDGSGRVDYAVDEVTSEKLKPGEGLGAGLETLDDSGVDTTLYRSRVRVRRLGEVALPVEIEVAFGDGERISESWDGRYRWKRFEYLRPAKINYAVVDPRYRIVLDLDRTNNSRRLEPDRRGAIRWALRWLVWWQDLLITAGLFS